MSEWISISPRFGFAPKDGIIAERSDGTWQHRTNSLGTKIDIFQDRFRSWLLDGARRAMERDDTLVGLMVASALVEGLQRFRDGDTGDLVRNLGDAKEKFLAGMDYVFEDDKEWSDAAPEDKDRFWKLVRCGLAHDGFIRGAVLLGTNFDSACRFKGDKIFVNPEKFLSAIDQAHQGYIEELRALSDDPIKTKFISRWTAIWEMSKGHLEDLDLNGLTI